MPLTHRQSLLVGKGSTVETTARDLEKRIQALAFEARVVSLSVTERANAFYLIAVVESV